MGGELGLVVGLDPGVRLAAPLPGVITVNAREAGQARALNAAVAASRGDVLAFLEDDDVWHPRRLDYGMGCLEGRNGNGRIGILPHVDMVTCNQLEMDQQGRIVQVNDYPTPSGWLLPRAVWKRIGPFDETFSFPDSEYLGRVNGAGLRWVHLVEAGASGRVGLANIARFSAIAQTGEREPLVLRSINPEGVMGNLQRREEVKVRHEQDCRRLVEKYGGIPW